jgi:hypothetical protein
MALIRIVRDPARGCCVDSGTRAIYIHSGGGVKPPSLVLLGMDQVVETGQFESGRFSSASGAHVGRDSVDRVDLGADRLGSVIRAIHTRIVWWAPLLLT